jgi:hypothetical protein
MISHLPMLVQNGNLSLDPVIGWMSVKRRYLFPLIATSFILLARWLSTFAGQVHKLSCSGRDRMRMLSVLPRVTERTRERVAREFDDLGPDVCMNSIIRDLQRHNPELLDMASKWASDVGAADRIITAFGMFYRLLSAETLSPLEPQAVSPLPRVSAETRGLIVRRIDQIGSESFTHDAIDRIEATNPELLQMAHGFASACSDYARVMQGFALLYETLRLQAESDKAKLH